MPARTLTQIASQLRRETIPTDAAGATDRDLLARFLDEQDEAAFESLVRRHDRLVRSAVAKVLPDSHDAEDAFQATFLVLVRRAKSIDWRAGLGPWLYGVAHRVAVKARDAGRTRSRKEKEVGTKSGERDAAPDLSWREACALLHAELDKLPDRYRLPLLLCYLDGKTRDEAAAALKVTVGTVKGRLERGREMLRDRLARRGVALSAGLFAAVASANACASSATSVSALLEVVRGSVPARVLALTREATAASLLSKMTSAVAGVLSLVAVASALIAAGATGPLGAPPEKEATPTRPAADAPPADPKPKEAPPAPGTVTIKGHLIGPDKRSEPGVTVAVWAAGKKLGETKTTKDNMFQVSVPGPLPNGAKVVATKPGFAPDWADVPADPDKTPVTLHAVPDDGVISGRVTDLEGRAVPNLPVAVERIGRPKPGKTLDDHIKANADYRSRGTTSLFDLDSVSAEAAGLPKQVTTDKDGKFKITGVGKDRSVRITTRGETTEHLQVRVVTRDIDAKLEQHGPFGLHGATFTLRVGPSRLIVGTVRDAKTGAGVPGMKIAELVGHICETETDKNGKFRLIGVKKDARYLIGTGSQGEAPYLDANAMLDDPQGFGAITADIKVHRGVVVTGRVTEAVGKPVAGRMFYAWTQDNPHVKEYPGITDARVVLSHWGDLDRDGRYKLLAIPGGGAVGVCASPEDAFPRLDTRKELSDRSVWSNPADALHAVVAVKIDPKDAKTLTHDFTLTAGKARAIVVRGVDGKLPDKLLAVGQTEALNAKLVAGDTIKLTGLSPKRARAVVLMDEAKAVGAVAAVTGDAEAPVTVTLEKLGSAAGRVFDADGNPAAGAEVRVWLHLDRAKYDNLPDEVSTSLGVSGIAPGAWQRFTSRTTKTDKDGKFKLDGLLPGQEYHLVAGFNVENRGGELLHRRNGVTVKPGEANDLGDLKPKK